MVKVKKNIYVILSKNKSAYRKNKSFCIKK